MLKERIVVFREGLINNGPVVYWMSRDQRAEDNWAIIYAQELAIERKAPLVVVFCLVPEFLDATLRQYAFMLSGLKELSHRLEALSIPFFILTGNPGISVPKFVVDHGVSVLVSDFDPLRPKKQWKEEVERKTDITFFQIDAHNIVPCAVVSQKAEYGAYTIRKKIQRALPIFMDDLPSLEKHPFSWKGMVPTIEWRNIVDSLIVDRTVKEVEWIIPGEKSARESLESFIETGLELYENERNNPVAKGQSDLSPYLHFGQLSAQRVALEITKAGIIGNRRDVFLEELIIRRELSDNFCFYNPFYDSFDGFPAWARQSLDRHREDKRPFLYSREEFERAETHDLLWNASQMEMVRRGKMHGYMRMYWAKKILEWTESPEEAMDTAIYLNDRYELDGRDPNGYAGVAWSIGGVHDRAWNERSVFGKIRYMSYNGCKSKFNIKTYIENVKKL